MLCLKQGRLLVIGCITMHDNLARLAIPWLVDLSRRGLIVPLKSAAEDDELDLLERIVLHCFFVVSTADD